MNGKKTYLSPEMTPLATIASDFAMGTQNVKKPGNTTEGMLTFSQATPPTPVNNI